MSQLSEVIATLDDIRPLLAGKPAEVQGAVLAELLATWLAGHQIAGDEYLTRQLRTELLATHCAQVVELTKINAKIMYRGDEA